jgi:PTH2 family peptidyl-tRNA hydrolase
MEEEIVMYILINKSLKMSPGKVAAQVGHGVGKIYENLDSQSELTKVLFDNWKNKSYTKITLKSTLDEMIEISKLFPSVLIMDEGRTQIEPSNTVLCVYPVTKNEIFHKFKLY